MSVDSGSCSLTTGPCSTVGLSTCADAAGAGAVVRTAAGLDDVAVLLGALFFVGAEAVRDGDELGDADRDGSGSSLGSGDEDDWLGVGSGRSCAAEGAASRTGAAAAQAPASARAASRAEVIAAS